jgi:cytochrome o ubiquinol oxidase subunit 2
MVVLASLIGLLCLQGCSTHFIGILNPKGVIAYEERKLFFDTLALMLIVVLPVIVMSLVFIEHYKVSHRKAEYNPNMADNYFLESLWWGIPCVIIFILSVVTWKKTHELDPYRTVPGHRQKPPLQIQVIALPWKWLFIYPQQKIASLNQVVLPVGQEVQFSMTTDNVPMSAFFIPQLGGQIYVMAGMRSSLHLVGNEVGTYDGMNTQFNGDGFSEMHFSVKVLAEPEMTAWIKKVQSSSPALTTLDYHQLLNPSIGDSARTYSNIQAGLFEDVLKTYMMSNGTIHPRDNQIKFYNGIDEHKE